MSEGEEPKEPEKEPAAADASDGAAAPAEAPAAAPKIPKYKYPKKASAVEEARRILAAAPAADPAKASRFNEDDCPSLFLSDGYTY